MSKKKKPQKPHVVSAIVVPGDKSLPLSKHYIWFNGIVPRATHVAKLIDIKPVDLIS